VDQTWEERVHEVARRIVEEGLPQKIVKAGDRVGKKVDDQGGPM
jgi:hypothetical protein